MFKTIELTNNEQQLYDVINFDCISKEYFDTTGIVPDEKQQNAAVQLMKSLIKREAIPEIRWEYFTDPKHCLGRGNKSYKELFKQHGWSNEQMYEDNNFIHEFLYYFIHGPRTGQKFDAQFDAFIDSIHSTAYSTNDYHVAQRKFIKDFMNKTPVAYEYIYQFGLEYFKIKKDKCRYPVSEHLAGNLYIALKNRYV